MKGSLNSKPIRRGSFFLADKNCPLAYEPSGEDFLSPCLGEADVMRRVLTQTEFAKWLTQFSASNSKNGDSGLVAGGDFTRSERSKAGASRWINLSRAWMLEGILSSLPADDPRVQRCRAQQEAHRRARARSSDWRTLRRRPLARQLRSLSHDAARDREMTSGRFPRRPRVYYSSAVSFDSRRGAPPEGFQARRCQKSFQVASAASKNVEFCFSNIGNTYGVSRTRQSAFTVTAVLPQSPVTPRRRCTWFLWSNLRPIANNW